MVTLRFLISYCRSISSASMSKVIVAPIVGINALIVAGVVRIRMGLLVDTVMAAVSDDLSALIMARLKSCHFFISVI